MTANVRILYTAVDTPIPGVHGGSVHVLELCRRLSRRGHDVHIMAPRDEASDRVVASATLEECGSGHLHMHEMVRPRPFLEWTAVSEVERHARSVEPDVVVERFYTFSGAGIWAAHRLGIPSVLEVNSPARPYPGSWRDRLDRISLVRPIDRWRRRQLTWGDAVYATSKHLLPPDMHSRVTIVTNGVDIDRFRPGTSSPTHNGPLRCVYASSFRSWHGAEDLVRAVAICMDRGVDLRVTCLGTGPRWVAAREAASRAGILSRIDFIGQVPFDRVPEYFADADVGLAPFNPAAFSALKLGWFWSPIKIFEYLAAGLSIVTIDIAELRALIPSSVARFYPAGNVVGLADQLSGLAANRAALVRSRPIARLLAESRYTWDHQATAVEVILRKVVD